MNSVSRRQFLQTSAVAAGALSLAPIAAAASKSAASRCILIMLTGGPSQLETFDPKPDAPSHIRGPFGSIPTRIPGVRFGEHLPQLAELADRCTLLRSVHHHDAPIHETGMQWLQTGQQCETAPHLFAGLGLPATLLPGPIESTGVPVSHGQLGLVSQPASALSQERYGYHPLGRACHQARTLVETGTPLVAVNMFTALYDRVTWDCHADGYCLNSTLEDYRRTLCPMLDQALSALIRDLEESGLLESTLVVAMGEMGRTPTVNDRGGRDHWTGVWSMLMAGGGMPAGGVIGSSDAQAGSPKDRPIHAREVHGAIVHQLGGVGTPIV